MQKSQLIGTTAVFIVAQKEGFLIDILVQNLSANNVYFGSDLSVDVNTGTKIAAQGEWTNDKRFETVCLIADGANSNCRITIEVYKAGSR